MKRYVDVNWWVCLCSENSSEFKRNKTHALTIPEMCAWIFKGGILDNSPVLTCCCVFSLNKWTCFIFTRSLLLRCMNQNYTWSLAVFGSLPLHKYHLYAPTLCCSLLCWLALAHRGASIDFQKAFMLATTAHWNHIFTNGPSVSHCMEHPIFSDSVFVGISVSSND